MSTRYGDRGFDRYEDEDRYGGRESERPEERGYGEYGSRPARGYYGSAPRGQQAARDYDDAGRDSARDYSTDYDRGYSARGYRGRAYVPRYGREGSYGGPSERDYGYGRRYRRDYGG